MGPIIRAAAVSGVTRELRRLPARGTPAPAAPAAAAPAAPAPAAPAPAAPAPAAAAPAAAAPAAAPKAPMTFAAPATPPAARPPAAAAPLAPQPAAPQQAAPQQAAVPQNTAADQEAARLRAEQELGELRAEAERRGYAAGHEKGEAAARQLLQSQIDRFQRLAAQMVQAKAGVLEDGEDAVVELAFAALCRILGEQASTRGAVLAMVRQCAIASHEREQVGVRLHPDDLALLGPASGHQVRFSADHDIELGGCIVDSSTGSLDARLETQLARLRETLVAVRAARQRPEEAV